MGEMSFSDNYSDLSREHGVDAGFQFEFFCERCNDRWRSEFIPFTSGRAAGWLEKAAGMFGGVLGGAGSAAQGLAQAGWGEARDREFKKALEQAKQHFHRCAKCMNYVCDRCWNAQKGLCMECAPCLEAEIEAARMQGERDGAVEAAAEEGRARGQKAVIAKDRQLVCPKCNAETHGAKFCPECGAKLAVKRFCEACGGEAGPDAKFCPDCGKPMGR
jgi:hypothetical protein